MFKRILSVYKGHKLGISMLLGIIFLGQGMILVSPYIFGRMMDSIIHKDGIRTSLLLATSTLLLAGIGYVLSLKRMRVSQDRVWFPIQKYLRFKTIDQYFSFSIGQHKNEHSGINAEITSKGEDALQRLATQVATYFIPLAVRLAITVAILLWLHLPLGIIVVCGMFVYGFGQWNMEKKYSVCFDKSRNANLESSKYRGDIMRGAVLIKSHGKESLIKEEYGKKFTHSVNVMKEINLYVVKWDGAMNIVVALTQFFALVAGIIMLYQGKLTMGQLVTAQMWWQQACGMVSEIGSRYQDVLEQASSVRKFFDLIDTPPAIKEIENPIRLNELAGEIVFKNISFSYPRLEDEVASRSVLRNISLHIQAGEFVAIVGPSGCGKTTLTTLLLRGYDPDSGDIQIDGHHLRDLALKDYYKHVAVVDQASLMIDGTVRENLILGAHHSLSEEEVLDLCKMAEFDVEKFPKKLDHSVGQDGKRLSGGQRQRLAIARAMAGNPKVLILDEATASLDGIAEAKIQGAIKRASEGRTVIMIAHRIATIQNADRIVVMDEGQIVATGTHKELMTTCPLYMELAGSQMIEVAIDERSLEQ